MIVLLFMALFTPFNFMIPEMDPYLQCIGYLAIFGGAMLWWLFITSVVNTLRARFDVKGVLVINRVIGGAVLVGSVVGAILIATGVWSLH